MDAQAWDERYAGADFVWSLGPNQFVAEVAAGLEGDTALDLAGGEGRNALWLAERGWSVTAVDFSSVALRKGRTRAEAAGLVVDWVEADLTTWTPPATYDLVVVAYLQVPAAERTPIVARAAGVVATGGRLLVVGHDRANLTEGTGGPQSPEVLYSPADVVADLEGSGLRVERAETVTRVVDGAPRPALDCLVVAQRRAAS